MARVRSAAAGWRADLPAAAICLLGGIASLLVFAPWRPPLPVSDAWFHLEVASGRDLLQVVALVVPVADNWYRPLSDLAYFLTWHLLGTNVGASFLLHVLAHVGVAVLIGVIGLHLTGHRVAAAMAGVAFLVTLPAHEVVFDYADTHRLLGGLALSAAVLAWVRGHRGFGLAFVVLGLLVDEAGLLAGPILSLYELTYRDRGAAWRPALRAAATRLAPVALVLTLYLGARLLAGGLYSEATDPCRTPTCLADAAMEYTNRLIVRGDFFLARIWYFREAFAAASVAALAVAAVALRSWRWVDGRLAAFGLGWAVMAALFFAVALWPYVSDRFLYVSHMGVSLAIAAIVVAAGRSWRSSTAPWRVAVAAVLIALVAWIGLGAHTIWYRGDRWVAAGAYALDLGTRIAALLPDPAPGTTVVIRGVPQFLRPLFPPGNTGPYLYVNGLPGDLRLRHGWDGVAVYSFRPLDATASPPADVLLQVLDDGTVLRLR